MLLKLLSYLWKVIKALFWSTDESKPSKDEILDRIFRTQQEDFEKYLRRIGYTEEGFRPYDHTSCREDQSDDFVNYFTGEIPNEFKFSDYIQNRECNTRIYSRTSDKSAYNYLNKEGSDEKFRYLQLRREWAYDDNDSCLYGGGRRYDGFYRYDSFGRRLYNRYDSSEKQKCLNEDHIRRRGHFKETAETGLYRTDRDFDKIPPNNPPNLKNDHQSMENFMFAFYEHLHKHLCHKLSLSPQDVKLAMEKLMFNYKRLNKCETPQTLNFNDMAICLGYLHRYAICHAALVYHTVIKLLFASTSFLSVFSKEKLNMMCLGSGPGNDFIGFAFALFNSSIKLSNLDVTIVDKFSGWYTIFSETIEMFDSLTIKVYKRSSKTFLQADLSNFSSWNISMREKLYMADIVSLVKVLSNISEDNHLRTLKNIVGLMKDGAFLIIIDCPLPLSELSALDHYLHPVYASSREKFNFKEKKTRFGYPNISQCTAYIRVYKKRNSVRYYR